MEKEREHTWWFLGQKKASSELPSCQPRNSRALVPESTVVTATRKMQKHPQRNKQTNNQKNQTFPRNKINRMKKEKSSTLIRRSLEKPLNKFPINQAVINS